AGLLAMAGWRILLVVHAFPCRSCRRLRSFDLDLQQFPDRKSKIKIKRSQPSAAPTDLFSPGIA
ncbi:hypothetical protein, partial [Pseudomonas sp. GM33]|uniref:hypothetical protein n=1 Tax=Pseudomonas sp. GM33 TaxID=1144329 RepID=UPI001EE6884A